MSFDFNDPNISDLEFAQRLSNAAKEVMASYSPDDYVVDRNQLKRFDDLVNFFKSSADELGGKIKSVNITPAYGVGDVTADFLVFDLSGDDIKRFCNVIQHCSAISMDVTVKDEICISCTIPGIFVRKDLV